MGSRIFDKHLVSSAFSVSMFIYYTYDITVAGRGIGDDDMINIFPYAKHLS